MPTPPTIPPDKESPPYSATEPKTPCDFKTERAVLSAMLENPDGVIPSVIDKSKPEFFYVPANRLLYQTITAMHQRGNAIDLPALIDTLREKSELDRAGGPSGLSEIFETQADVNRDQHLDPWIDILKDHHARRELLRVCDAVAVRAREDGQPISELLDEAEGRVRCLRQSCAEPKPGAQDLKTFVVQAVSEIQEAAENPGLMAGISTGFCDLDAITGGLQDGQLILIAGQIGVGKTSFLTNLIENIAMRKNNPLPVGWITMQESGQSAVQRIFASSSGITIRNLRDGKLKKNRDYSVLTAKADQLANSKDVQIAIDDRPGRSIFEVRSLARRWKQQKNIQLLLIDSLQFLIFHHSDDKRETDLAEIADGLKSLAQELEIPIVITSSFDRPPPEYGYGVPSLRNLRTIWPLVEEADLVSILHQDDWCDLNAPLISGLYILKQRHGPTGHVELEFLPDYLRFQDCQEETPGEDIVAEASLPPDDDEPP